jgi:putative transposase
MRHHFSIFHFFPFVCHCTIPFIYKHRKNFNDAGHAHELTFSCYRGYQFLKAERTCEWLATAIEEARDSLAFDFWAFVFMPEHVHLLIRPREAIYDIADIRLAIKAPVGQQAMAYLQADAPEWLPRVTRQRGDKTERLFWQSGGGYDRNITEPSTLMHVIDYIHNNPVRRGLVEHAWEWKWSSAAFYLGMGDSPIRLDPIPWEWVP